MYVSTKLPTGVVLTGNLYDIHIDRHTLRRPHTNTCSGCTPRAHYHTLAHTINTRIHFRWNPPSRGLMCIESFVAFDIIYGVDDGQAPTTAHSRIDRRRTRFLRKGAIVKTRRDDNATSAGGDFCSRTVYYAIMPNRFAWDWNTDSTKPGFMVNFEIKQL